VSIGFIGSGNYAGAVLIPAFKATGARLRVVASIAGVSGAHAARKFGFESTTTDIDAVLGDPDVNAVVIATRHDSHSNLVVAALDAGKHVFVEKPLALTETQLAQIEAAHERRPDAVLTVGFNRRFAPHVQRIHALLEGVSEPKVFLMTVNAGAIPPEHWTQDPRQGGGRIIGEACHFIDLLRFLAKARIVDFQASCIGSAPGIIVREDKASITLRFADGSIGTILYLANGDRSFPKERLEVFAAGRILQLDNFRRMSGFGWPGFSRMNLWRQDKGQRQLAAAFVSAVSSGSPPPIAIDELLEVGHVTVQIAEALP
jgi:predicted dehydrogenase